MLVHHFKDHKQKYTVFLILALLVIAGMYLIYKVEAFGVISRREALGSGFERHCPPFLRRIKVFVDRYPCFQDDEYNVPSTVTPQPILSATEEQATTTDSIDESDSQATSTPTDDTSDVATSTSDIAPGIPQEETVPVSIPEVVPAE